MVYQVIREDRKTVKSFKAKEKAREYANRFRHTFIWDAKRGVRITKRRFKAMKNF